MQEKSQRTNLQQQLQSELREKEGKDKELAQLRQEIEEVSRQEIEEVSG